MSAKRKPFVVVLAVTATVGMSAWSQVKKSETRVEDQIRQTCFRYYFGVVFGDEEEYRKVTRLPLFVIRDGIGSYRDEKQTRAMLAAFAKNIQNTKLGAEDKKQMGANMIAKFEEASVQFIGADTAAVTFELQRGTKPGEGDKLGHLILYRAEGRWQVIAEVTDSKAIPPEYLLDVPPPPK
jgi:hypothetical protein